MRVGDWIIAIGNPYGLGGTVTAGIISARARDINSGPYDEYLQTDAPINRGNSGGPMFDMDGNVVGVNTAIFSPSGGSIGIGFAIPSSLAKNIVDQLESEHGHIRRGWLGVHIQNVTQDIADGLGLGEPQRCSGFQRHAGRPRRQSRRSAGDVITTFDGKDVPDMHRLPLMVAETDVDKTVRCRRVPQRAECHAESQSRRTCRPRKTAEEEGKQQEAAAARAANAEKVDDLGI